MKHFILIVSVIFLLLLQSISCRKDSVLKTTTANYTEHADAIISTACSNFKYADTIFYISPLTTNYIVKPLRSQTGTYGVFPQGLVIDPLNGAINVSKSETGLRYMVWFKPANTNDTCKKFITISGINYLDSIFVLNSTRRSVSKPIFNAKRTSTTTTSTTARGEIENEFDDCPDATQRLRVQGVAINALTGAIDLNQTLANGAFGSTKPVSGTFKDFLLNYRLSDSSKFALNKIALRMYYFKTKDLIPASLKREIRAKRAQILFTNSPTPTLQSTSSSLTQRVGEVKCRPPYLIVVGG